MKTLTILLALLFTTVSMAGPGHKHGHGHGHSHSAPEVAKEKLSGIGQMHIDRLVKAKKLDSTWLKAKFDKAVVKKNEWLLTYDNEDGIKGKKLYIFLKKSGEFVAANFTGK
tara:strand:+ start:3818 stop:4153 length:336 start_codon:yes stop_codon:yes gene_type:complete